VIASGRSDDAALPLVRGQQFQSIARPALLETPGPLEILEFAVNLEPGRFGEWNRQWAGRLHDMPSQADRRGFDVLNADSHANHHEPGLRRCRTTGCPLGKSDIRVVPKSEYLIVRQQATPYTPARMITAIQLIFSPFETWQKIALAERGFLRTLSLYLLPLLIIALGVEVYCLNRWGEKQGEFGDMIRVPMELGLRYGVAYLVLLLAAIVLSAKFVGMIAESFNVRTGFTQCFVMVAYAFGPIIMTRIIDGFPQLNTWVCWVIGAASSVSVLYHGIGMMLKPEQTKGFGLYLISVITIVLVSGLAHFAALGVLHGKVLRPALGSQTILQPGHSLG
jgi:hypothetical protein